MAKRFVKKLYIFKRYIIKRKGKISRKNSALGKNGKKYLEEEKEYDKSHAKFVIKTSEENGHYKNSESAKVIDFIC